jgi:hypothetical protein
METTISRTRRRSRAIAVVLVVMLSIAVGILAIQARSLSSPATSVVRPAVTGVTGHAPSKDEYIRSHRHDPVRLRNWRQVEARKG